jgi:hypothetical protein
VSRPAAWAPLSEPGQGSEWGWSVRSLGRGGGCAPPPHVPVSPATGRCVRHPVTSVVLIDEFPLNARLETGVGLSFFPAPVTGASAAAPQLTAIAAREGRVFLTRDARLAERRDAAAPFLLGAQQRFHVWLWAAPCIATRPTRPAAPYPLRELSASPSYAATRERSRE